mmetsp:Transcript_35952/g.73231  ORF Transcript_35952/g.73231 Transcript_35952/m.73231 type:complete len:92 (-) Transcript_35952:47-322(-)
MLLGIGLGVTTTVAPREDWKLRCNKQEENDQNGEVMGGWGMTAIEGRAVFNLWGMCTLSVFWHPKASGEVTEEANCISLFNDSHVGLFDEN